MIKGKTIYLRLIEPEDLENTYLWHNDFDIQKMTCGSIRFVSKEIERNWLLSKTSNNQKDIYLAICAIENDKMIGLYSINDIDLLNRKCRLGGVVIGDKEYRDGDAHREAGKIVTDYAFNQLNMHKVTGSCLKEHIFSRADMETSGYHLDGILRDDVYKNGCYHDVCVYSLTEFEYRSRKNFDNERLELIFAKNVKRIKAELKAD